MPLGRVRLRDEKFRGEEVTGENLDINGCCWLGAKSLEGKREAVRKSLIYRCVFKPEVSGFCLPTTSPAR